MILFGILALMFIGIIVVYFIGGLIAIIMLIAALFTGGKKK